MNANLQKVTLAVLIVYASISLAVGAYRALEPGGSQDFVPPYMTSRMWTSGANPYEAHGYDPERWKKAVGTDVAPELQWWHPHAAPYPPVALVNLAPVSVLEWPSARLAWLVFNLILVAAVPLILRRVWYRNWSRLQFGLFTAFWLAGVAVRVHLGEGQHALFAFVCILGAVAAIGAGRPVLAGVLLAVSLHKFIFAAFLVPALIAKRLFTPLAATAGAAIVICGVFVLRLGGDGVQAIEDYTSQMLGWARKAQGLSIPGVGATDVFPVVQAVLGDHVAGKGVLLALVAMGVVLCVVLARRSPIVTDFDLALAMVLGLWVMYHDQYDSILLILPIAILWQRMISRKGRQPFLEYGALIVIGSVWLADAAGIGRVLSYVPVVRAFGPAGPYDRVPGLAYRLVVILSFALVALWHARTRLPAGGPPDSGKTVQRGATAAGA